MIVATALCPHPPLLFPGLSGERDVAAELRASCRKAVDALLARDPDALVVVGAADEARHWDPSLRFDVARFGSGPRRDGELPLSLGVGRQLLDEAGWTGHGPMVSLHRDATDEEISAFAGRVAEMSRRVALLVMGEGSARRGETAPGYLDERAAPFDQAVADALEKGDAAALRNLDTTLANELMVSGSTAFRLLGAAWPDGPDRARLLYADDPFGVLYLVAVWEDQKVAEPA